VYAFAAAHPPELRLHRNSRADWDRLAERLDARHQQAQAQAAVAGPVALAGPQGSATDSALSTPAELVSDGRITAAGIRRFGR
jgi:hypothetical protein